MWYNAHKKRLALRSLGVPALINRIEGRTLVHMKMHRQI